LNNRISDKDKKDWESFIESSEKLPNKDLNNSKKKFYKVRSIDLHGYSLDEANKIIEDLIYNAYLKSVNKLIVVTGKGLHSDNEKDPYISKDLGILKYSVPEFILNNRNLMSMINEIKEAEIEDGGAGAFYIFLKKNKSIK
jgi:DNA-nicking Smr family endonuclease